MRFLLTATAIALLATPVMADPTGPLRAAPTGPFPNGPFASPQEHMKACAGMWKGMNTDAQKQTTYQAYTAACMKSKGQTSLAAPTSMTGVGAPAGATAQCKDGTYTTAKTHAGACSRHGGVSKWM